MVAVFVSFEAVHLPVSPARTGGHLPVALHNDKLEVNTICHSLNQLNVRHYIESRHYSLCAGGEQSGSATSMCCVVLLVSNIF